jgi:hypothetical protein
VDNSSKIYSLLERHLPANAVHYCFDLWHQHPFNFKVARTRSSKLGDYRFEPAGNRHSISVNHSLNPYNFLITYLHEFAHLLCTIRHKNRCAPHGKEWKAAFKEVMQPVMNDLVFPTALLPEIYRHMANPKASSQADHRLAAALRSYDQLPEDVGMLNEIDEGALFIFQGIRYEKMLTRRTRVLCHQVHSGKKYLIPKVALVKKVGS